MYKMSPTNVTSQGSLNTAMDPFPLAAAMVVMDFAVKWMRDVRQKKKKGYTGIIH